MRRNLIIPGLLFALIVFSAKRCAEDPASGSRFDETDWLEARDSISRISASEILDTDALMAYEGQACQKVQDFFDYLRIASEDTLDPVFRTQADSLIPTLFIPGTVPSLKQVVPAGLWPDSIRIADLLHRSGPAAYRGTVSFWQCNTDPAGEGTILVPRYRRIDFFVVRTPLQAGGDTLRTWRVLLGEMK